MSDLRTVPADSILSMDAYTLAQRIHAGELSSVAVTQAFLDRIQEIDGDIHAFLHLSLIHISSPRDQRGSRMPSSA